MIAERHNGPLSNVHASQAGNAENCKSGAHPSPSWRRLGRFFAAAVLASFVLNEIWEMAQMSAYVETAGHSWTSTLAFCTRAAVGDVGIILGICAAGAQAAGNLGWGLRDRWNIYATAAVLGLAYAALVVHGAHARCTRAWRGSVAATPNDAAASAHDLDCPVVGWSQRNQRHFMMNQTDGWMGGWARRRDVALDGDRGSGGGPAGRRDYQAVQEIIVRSRPACKE